MAEKIKKCTIVSGAPINDSEFLRKNIDLDSFIIAADSGYKKLLEADLRIDCIVADFDSSDKPDINCEIIQFPIEKAYGDTYNSVMLAIDRGYAEITIFFALGGRFDHSYSNLLCLALCKDNGVKCTLVDRNNRVSLIDKKHSFKADYSAFSLFAFMNECKGIKISGAYYTQKWHNKDEFDLKLSDTFAQSNYVTDEVCEITLKEGTLLLIESNDCNN